MPPAVRRAISDPAVGVHVSAASVWEAIIKSRLGRDRVPPLSIQRFREAMKESRFAPLQVTMEHALAVSDLPPIHEDPFDRLLIAQAKSEDMTLVTHDKVVQRYPIKILPA